MLGRMGKNVMIYMGKNGEECYDIYDKLLIPGMQKSYHNAIQLFDGHFKPKSNISYENYTFRKIKQNADETINTFFICVKQQAVKCDFGENLNNEVKQQMILARTNNQLRRYCFQNPGITLEEFQLMHKPWKMLKVKSLRLTKVYQKCQPM